MIQFQRVSVRFGNVEALRDVTFELQKERTSVLIGPSGCGKSTLLRLLVGLETPSSGTVRIDGTSVSPKSLPSLRRRIGYVIQEGGLFPHLTARQNVTLLAGHLRVPAPEAGARLEELKEIFQRLKKTVVFVTHDLVEAAYLADRIILMRAGEVVQEGTLEDLRRRPAVPFVSDFLAAQRRPVEI